MKRSTFMAWLGGLVGVEAWGQKKLPMTQVSPNPPDDRWMDWPETPQRIPVHTAMVAPNPLEDPYYGAELKITYPDGMAPCTVKVSGRIGDVVFFVIPQEGDEYLSMITVNKWREWIKEEMGKGTRFEVVR